MRDLFIKQESGGDPSPSDTASGHEILAYVGGKPLSWEDIERLADQESVPEDSSEPLAANGAAKARRWRRLMLHGAVAASIIAVSTVAFRTYGIRYLREHSHEAMVGRDLAARSVQSLELTERSPFDEVAEQTQPQFIMLTDAPTAESERIIKPAIVENDVRNELNSHAFPDIGVSADTRGEVYLAGVVYNPDDVPKIKRIAYRVQGVKVVYFLHPDLRAPSGQPYFGAIARNDPSVFGAKVDEVVPGSPAEKAGIKRGDVIREFNNQTIPDAHTLDAQVAACQAGDRVEVRINRGGMDEILGARLLDNTVLAGG
jgi:PDZ domain/BON domain